MWSHYAAKHSGLVLGFDESILVKDIPVSNALIDVEYNNERITYRHHSKSEDFFEMFKALAKRKNLDWSYEKETRLLLPNQFLLNAAFLPYNPFSLKVVIIGATADDSLLIRAKSLLRDQGFKAKLRKASLCGNSYKLVFNDIP